MVTARARAMRMPAATVLAGVAAIGAVLAADPTSESGIWLPPCPIEALTGLDCPGCGGTRAVWSLLHGDLPTALDYNAVAVLLLPVALGLWGAWVVGRWRGAPPRFPRWRGTPFVLLGLAAAWMVLRNLPFPPFTALRA
ncbi:DUF2752 domain-containing protein [Saccharopolyspora griseoalba]|uniref:DUF2752 domain-containing protein n=1 Tax=Saccharopolyspora griseoalba TaxID=1431848 RepID=A0ABW2LLD3_9PSEU